MVEKSASKMGYMSNIWTFHRIKQSNDGGMKNRQAFLGCMFYKIAVMAVNLKSVSKYLGILG